MEVWGANFFLVRPDGKILLQKRDWKKGIRYPGRWAIPGGRREEGETTVDCAVREIAEETGLVVGSDDLEALTDFSYPYRGVSYTGRQFFCRVGDAEVRSGEGQMHWKTLEEVKKLRLPYDWNSTLVPALEARLKGEP